jgi:hypothetical protein
MNLAIVGVFNETVFSPSLLVNDLLMDRPITQAENALRRCYI